MKATRVIFIIIWALAIQFDQAQAQQFGVKTCKLTVKGTSSIHDWESTVEKMETKGSIAVANNTLQNVGDVVVKIPVKSIKSPKGKMMDNKTWDAFDHEKNPLITFSLTNKKINAGNKTLDATGTLTMAGVTRAIDLKLGYKILSDGLIQITGSKKLKMTDFKMDPPTAMMGTIKVGDEVEVAFEMVLTFESETALMNKK